MKHRYLKNVVTLQPDHSRCTGCGICLTVCPQQVFSLQDKRSVITDRDACLECGACARNCAYGAISVRAGVGCACGIIMGRLKKGKASSCSAESDCCCIVVDDPREKTKP